MIVVIDSVNITKDVSNVASIFYEVLTNADLANKPLLVLCNKQVCMHVAGELHHILGHVYCRVSREDQGAAGAGAQHHQNDTQRSAAGNRRKGGQAGRCQAV